MIRMSKKVLSIRKLAVYGSLALLIASAAVLVTTDGRAQLATDAGRIVGTCTETFPSYWQDPNPEFTTMWAGQAISGTRPPDWNGPVFRLSDHYPTYAVVESNQPWRHSRFDPLFDPDTDLDTRTRLATEYAWLVMEYIQQGNVSDDVDDENDWDVCDNSVRGWYHMPFQTYDALSGREFSHGLTREAPVTFNVRNPDHPESSIGLNTTMWAVAIFNPTAAYTIGRVWQRDGTAILPSSNLAFDDGAVVGKLLFTTASPAQLPMLTNMPAWQANISDPSFCKCTGADGQQCTLAEVSQQCSRSTTIWGPVRLLQFDISVKDSRAPGTEWVFATFVADGQRKFQESSWNRISLLGLMWGNDTPPDGQLAHNNPVDPRENGFAEEVIIWNTVDMLNEAGGEVLAQQPGHLGCNSRLNGPADNANSSCMSCHMTAAVPDELLRTPPIMAQFSSPSITSQCVIPDLDPRNGIDAAGVAAAWIDNIRFSDMDRIYFANTNAGTPVDMTANLPPVVSVLGNEPVYAGGRTDWISLDYSLQLSISLVQWGEWQRHLQNENTQVHDRVLQAPLPGR